MAKSFSEQLSQADIGQLTIEERLGLMIEYEYSLRQEKRLQSRLKKARLKQSATFEDIDYHQPRGLNRQLMLELSSCQWIKAHRNILIVGATGTGKTYLACALAHKACLEGYSSQYHRMTRLMPDLELARADGSYNRYMTQLAKMDVLLLDDWGLVTLNQAQRRDLLEIIDDRHNKSSTIVTSQLPIKLWHEMINDNTLADAILDRLVHNSYRIELSGASMRKKRAEETKKEDTDRT